MDPLATATTTNTNTEHDASSNLDDDHEDVSEQRLDGRRRPREQRPSRPTTRTTFRRGGALVVVALVVAPVASALGAVAPVRATTTTSMRAYRDNLQVMVSDGTSENDDDEDTMYEGQYVDPAVLPRREGRPGEERSRNRLMEEMLAADDEEWKEKRRIVLRERRKEEADAAEREERESVRTTELAKQVGVTLTMLEPSDYEDDDEDDDDDNASTSSSSVPLNLPTEKRRSKGSGWMEEIDRQIEEEEGPRPRKITAKKKSGVLVGSAGGWTLEVFPGDFVVHRKYGIGRFERTTVKPKVTLTEEELTAQSRRRQELVLSLKRELDADPSLDGAVRERRLSDLSSAFGTDDDDDPVSHPRVSVLEIAYKDAVVHVPVERAYRLSRYRAGDAAVAPRLSRVRGEAWRNAKDKVSASTAALAQDVLALYAKRETLRRPPFSVEHEGPARTAFEESFPYEPTPDQRSCFEAVENDMVWRERPMDRLVCGDVGFGKTEVALRALYRCVSNGRQAALLAPTGVLAAQHYRTVCERLEPFGVSVGLLRGGMGKNTKVGRELRERVAAGDMSVVVGTHALLSNSIDYHDLGLLVVDEEQRFGVKQKERLKLICDGVDVLTLSATPIPRTLQMSLSGIRDTSTIRSPPPMRKPILSRVEAFSEDVVREAVQRELDRGGQCFFVVPRISMIEDSARLVRELFPDVRLIVAHGRMPRHGAEENVALFAEGKADVLLATTVIENGVDIPTVNTIIINNAQSFGMSTLYQLRGRVGRSDRQAYAYFLHDEDYVSEQGAARLQAMADLHELGSGFDVANRDLEIRGAGSLLGTEQSGMAARVGFDLYMRMLKRSIRQLRRLDLPKVPRTNILLPYGEGSIEGDNAFTIPKSFVKDSKERLRQEGSARLAESTDKLVELTKQWKDEYGPLPPRLQGRIKKLHLHACTRQLGIDLVGIMNDHSPDDDDEVDDGTDDAKRKPRKKMCVLRAPALRVRHLARIAESLPRKQLPKGLAAVFPERFSKSRIEREIVGGTRTEWRRILDEDEVVDDDDELDDTEEDDAREEIEASRIVSSVDVDDVEESDVEDYPRLIVTGFENVKRGARVDAILKVLLPVVKVVAKNQEDDKQKAKVAVELRDKREEIKKKRKEQNAKEKLRSGYYY